MKKKKLHFTGLALSLVFCLPAQQQINRSSSVLLPVEHDKSLPLRYLPIVDKREEGFQGESEPVTNLGFQLKWNEYKSRIKSGFAPDPVVQSRQGNYSPNRTLVNIDGQVNRDLVNPPDPNGDVGINHYIQTVNASFMIFSKTGETLYGPAGLGTIWQGMGANYPSDGDPIVLYDHLADRWIISQFSFPNYPVGPGFILIAVTSTGDPLGSWYRYAYKFDNFCDYPKIGVWPDGYYLSLHYFTFGTPSTWLGPTAAVLERDSMLNGREARLICFQNKPADDSMLPADLDGPSPPEGSPGYFLMVCDDSYSGGVDRLQVYQLKADWSETANSTLSGPEIINTAAFDFNMCGGEKCIPQRTSQQKLDVLADRLMFRVQYRNFGTYQVIMANHTVDADGKDHAGIRWYELRNYDSIWTIFQQGTYAPDANSRWMGSIAMDGLGNIALGYSVSSDSVDPSIRATGRRNGDPEGLMTFREEFIVIGKGSQNMLASRWGDYTMMAVDPVDDLTFWYTNQYFNNVYSVWDTRIASFTINDLQGLVPDQTIRSTNTILFLENFPDPFSASTTIHYSLSSGQHVTLKVYNILGRELATLADDDEGPGEKSILFHADHLPGGIYFYRLQAGSMVASRKMVVSK